VVPVTVDTDPDAIRRLCALWTQRDPGVDLPVLPSPHRTLVAPTVGFGRTQVEKGRFVIVCSPTSNRGDGATESCTTNEAHCWPQQFAHAPTPSSPRLRFAWTEHSPPPSEDHAHRPVPQICLPRCVTHRRASSADTRRSQRRLVAAPDMRSTGLDNCSGTVERQPS